MADHGGDTGSLPNEVLDAYDSQIEAARAAGDTALANELYRESMGAGDDDGTGAGDDAEGGEGQLEGTVPAPMSTELVEQVLGINSEIDGEEVAELRREWPGQEMNRNFGYIKFLLDEYVPPHLQEQIPDDIALLRLGASLGRELYHRHHANVGQHSEGSRNMSEINTDTFSERADELMTQESEARAQGNFGKSNRLQREIRAMFVRQYGIEPATGSSGGPTT